MWKVYGYNVQKVPWRPWSCLASLPPVLGKCWLISRLPSWKKIKCGFHSTCIKWQWWAEFDLCCPFSCLCHYYVCLAVFEYCVVLQYVDFCHVVSHSIPCQHLCWMLALHGLLGDVKKDVWRGIGRRDAKGRGICWCLPNIHVACCASVSESQLSFAFLCCLNCWLFVTADDILLWCNSFHQSHFYNLKPCCLVWDSSSVLISSSRAHEGSESATLERFEFVGC